MGNFVSEEIKLNKPENIDEIEKIINKLDLKPPEILCEMWKSIKNGLISNTDISISKPGTFLKFEKDGEFDGFDGYEKILNETGYLIGSFWSDTDSRSPIYYINSGIYSEKIISFPFSSLQIYYTEFNLKEFFNNFLKLNLLDEDEITNFFKNCFNKMG